jgi:hypothetical protein
MLFSDLALRREGASILPDYDLVVLDEVFEPFSRSALTGCYQHQAMGFSRLIFEALASSHG